jgi:hypothetical protein
LAAKSATVFVCGIGIMFGTASGSRSAWIDTTKRSLPATGRPAPLGMMAKTFYTKPSLDSIVPLNFVMGTNWSSVGSAQQYQGSLR